MIARYMRFYRDSESRILAMPIRRFFVLFDNIERLEAEETLRLVRVVSQPYVDPKKGDDGFITQLERSAKIKREIKKQETVSAGSAKDWGIGFKYKDKADDLSKGFYIEGGE